jgi:hypothetical protein
MIKYKQGCVGMRDDKNSMSLLQSLMKFYGNKKLYITYGNNIPITIEMLKKEKTIYFINIKRNGKWGYNGIVNFVKIIE